MFNFFLGSSHSISLQAKSQREWRPGAGTAPPVTRSFSRGCGMRSIGLTRPRATSTTTAWQRTSGTKPAGRRPAAARQSNSATIITTFSGWSIHTSNPVVGLARLAVRTTSPLARVRTHLSRRLTSASRGLSSRLDEVPPPGATNLSRKPLSRLGESPPPLERSGSTVTGWSGARGRSCLTVSETVPCIGGAG
eukprot:scaffold5064_cov115-Isochrysis_galbana.AAC.2